MDISPLKNVLAKDTYLGIGDNGVLDYSSIKDFMEKYYYKNNRYYIHNKHSNFRIEKPAGYKLIVNHKEILETSKNRFIYFNTEVDEMYEMQYRIGGQRPRPACNYVC